MDIKDLRDPAPVTPTPAAAPVRKAGQHGQHMPEGANREDTVEISEKGRSLAGEPDETNTVPQGTLAPDRLLELRRRLGAGDHNSPEMIRAIARGIVSHGDL